MELPPNLIISGAPVRSLVGTVLVAPTNAGSLMTYYETLIEPRIPFSGPPLARAMEIVIRRLTARVAAEAERRAALSSEEAAAIHD